MLRIFFHLTALCICFAIAKAASSWGYEGNNGPDHWASESNDCGGSSQSPIAIMRDDTVVNSSLGVFNRSMFDAHASAMLVKNTKHSLQVDLTNSYTISNLDILPGNFKAAQFHIHWGRPGEGGSEHTFNGKQYFGELHIVHYNTKYHSLGEAASKSDGLAVLGVFLEDNYPQTNLAFERFLNPVTNGSIKYYPDSQTISSTNLFSLETLLPGDLSEYYRYKGSLTTPPCYESVFWTVFATPIRISNEQANVLRRNLFESDANSTEVQLYGNFRPVQKLNGRVVTRSSSVCAGGSATLGHSSFVFVSTLSLLISLLFF